MLANSVWDCGVTDESHPLGSPKGRIDELVNRLTIGIAIAKLNSAERDRMLLR
jgi:hypothetical protein